MFVTTKISGFYNLNIQETISVKKSKIDYFPTIKD